VNRIVGMKSYGFEWFTTYGLSPEGAAAALVRQGVDWVAVQNLVDPLPGSAVDQAPPGPTYRDQHVRDALRDRGLRIFEATAVFHQPGIVAGRPDLRAIDAEGRPLEQIGWYLGMCPSSEWYLAERAALMEEVVDTFRPDGVFLSFIRFPGFWELWMPETRREEIAEYCFCDRCTGRFEAETGQRLPAGPVAARSAVLRHELRDDWTRWKCRTISGAVSTLAAAARRAKPGVDVMVNGIAFGRDDYQNATMEVLGQELEGLSASVDHFELMFYHQIQRRDPAPWIARVTAEARSRTARTLLACLQSKADYLDPLYAAGRRRPTIPTEEFVGALRAVAVSPADGVMVYHWKDFLEDEAVGAGHLSAALRAFKDGELV
jgi:hypothetical protein